MQLDTINKMSEIVKRNYNHMSPISVQIKLAEDIKHIAALLHELAIESYMKEP